MVGRLLVSVCQGDEAGFRPGIAKELKTNRKLPTHPSHGHRDRREACTGREILAVVTMGRIEVTYQPRGIAPRGIDHGIETMHFELMTDGSAQQFPIRQRLDTAGVGLRRLCDRLAPLHAWSDLRMEFPRGDNFFQRLYRAPPNRGWPDTY